MSPAWIERLKTAAVLLMMLLAYGIVGRMDYDDELRQQQAYRQVRELVMAAQWCAPKPGQRAMQEWSDGRLHCEITDNTGYGRAKRIVTQMDAPVLSYPLARSED